MLLCTCRTSSRHVNLEQQIFTSQVNNNIIEIITYNINTNIHDSKLLKKCVLNLKPVLNSKQLKSLDFMS